jgi:predicted Zn-dependent protease
MNGFSSPWRTAAASALASFVLAGCTFTGGGPSLVLPPDAPRVAGVERAGDRDHARMVAAFGGEVRAPAMERLLATVTGRLVAASERPSEPYQVTILDSPVVNAFALPSGRLYVTRGLLALANDTAELAAVLSHEIAHVALRHAMRRNELQARSTLVSRVTETLLNNPAEADLLRERDRFSFASFSRSQEIEADQAGVTVLAKAGFDPYGAPRFLVSLGRAGGGADADPSRPVLSGMLASHPSTSERISQALLAARRASAPGIGEADGAAYVAAIDGLAYGDDPADGLVRGRRFVHARFGVAFEAAEGFGLENTSRAVLGSTPDGSRRLLFDAVEGEGRDPAEVLRTTWTEGLESGSLETATVNGLPVATATSKGEEWSFRLAAIRVGATTFRLILAGRSLGPDFERTFRTMLGSVRQVTPEEARNVQPLRIRAVPAQGGDTPESFAARMLVPDRQVERFLVLNGLERGARLDPGTLYKVVSE